MEGTEFKGKACKQHSTKLKRIHAKIRKQMEFYFSASNLTKDKFLQKLIANNPDGYVELEVFKSFNKIKEITEDLDIIVAGISESPLLELSEDRKMLRRTTPLGPPKDYNACTIYVEKLPEQANQKWVKDVFQKFGTIDYVNIPYFKNTGKIKGYAFVEFQSPESAAKACEASKLKEGAENEVDEKVGQKRKCPKRETHLRVMSKAQWKSYRNKYLQLQRSTTAYLKKVVFLETEALKKQEQNNPEFLSPPPSKPNLEYQPAVILRITLKEPVVDISNFKNEIKSKGKVAYIEATVGTTEAFVRCHSSEDAKAIIDDKKLNQFGTIELLKNDDEAEYWKKIEQDRKDRYNNPTKSKKRGREKLKMKLGKINEHKNKHTLYSE